MSFGKERPMERHEHPGSTVSAKTIPSKKFSSPQTSSFGTLETLFFGGAGTVIEGAAMMKHP
jgi:hypothetical protein